jgi:hypothetical protein
MRQQITRLNVVLKIAGSIEILVGLLHFLMPYFVNKNHYYSLSLVAENNFITLLIFAVGILLIAFGGTTILFANRLKQTIDILYYYLIIQVILWLSRVVLEVLYPVQLSFFYIDPFTLLALPALVIEFLLFVFALSLVVSNRKAMQWEKLL